MNRTKKYVALLLSCTTVLLTGCLLRKETIRVAKDGSVEIQLAYEGKEQDWKTLDAMPSKASGWNGSESFEKEGDDRVKKFEAERRFPLGTELPNTFAADDDPDKDIYLSFPTTLRIEHRTDGDYLHFTRTYAPRNWSFVQFWENALMGDDIRKLADKPAAELTSEEREKMLKTFGEVEAHKQWELTQATLRKVSPELPNDHVLGVRHAILDAYERVDYDALGSRLSQLEEDQREAIIEKETSQVLAQAQDGVLKVLRHKAGWDDAMTSRYEKQLNKVKKSHEISSQLRGHAFEIHVCMPGEVVASDADKTDNEDCLVWEFTGEALMDRPHTVRITSKVPRSGK